MSEKNYMSYGDAETVLTDFAAAIKDTNTALDKAKMDYDSKANATAAIMYVYFTVPKNQVSRLLISARGAESALFCAIPTEQDKNYPQCIDLIRFTHGHGKITGWQYIYDSTAYTFTVYLRVNSYSNVYIQSLTKGVTLPTLNQTMTAPAEVSEWREVKEVLTEEYELPVASADTLGGIKVGDNLSIDEDGVLSAEGGGSVTIDSELSTTSENPVQNKIITAEVNNRCMKTLTVGSNNNYLEIDFAAMTGYAGVQVLIGNRGGECLLFSLASNDGGSNPWTVKCTRLARTSFTGDGNVMTAKYVSSGQTDCKLFIKVPTYHTSMSATVFAYKKSLLDTVSAKAITATDYADETLTELTISDPVFKTDMSDYVALPYHKLLAHNSGTALTNQYILIFEDNRTITSYMNPVHIWGDIGQFSSDSSKSAFDAIIDFRGGRALIKGTCSSGFSSVADIYATFDTDTHTARIYACLKVGYTYLNIWSNYQLLSTSISDAVASMSGSVQNALSTSAGIITNKQDKTLSSAMTIDGASKTTVEDALKALNSGQFIFNYKRVDANTDLDTLTVPGLYTVNTSDVSTTHSPFSGWVQLYVSRADGNASYTQQLCIDVNGNVYIRKRASSWSAWTRIATVSDLSGYQTKLTFDSTPTASSSNPVTSGGVYNKIRAEYRGGTSNANSVFYSQFTVPVGDYQFLISERGSQLILLSVGTSAQDKSASSTAHVTAVELVKGYGKINAIAYSIDSSTSATTIYMRQPAWSSGVRVIPLDVGVKAPTVTTSTTAPEVDGEAVTFSTVRVSLGEEKLTTAAATITGAVNELKNDRYTYKVNSNATLLNWVDNVTTDGQDYSRVYIAPGSYTVGSGVYKTVKATTYEVYGAGARQSYIRGVMIMGVNGGVHDLCLYDCKIYQCKYIHDIDMIYTDYELGNRNLTAWTEGLSNYYSALDDCYMINNIDIRVMATNVSGTYYWGGLDAMHYCDNVTNVNYSLRDPDNNQISAYDLWLRKTSFSWTSANSPAIGFVISECTNVSNCNFYNNLKQSRGGLVSQCSNVTNSRFSGGVNEYGGFCTCNRISDCYMDVYGLGEKNGSHNIWCVHNCFDVHDCEFYGKHYNLSGYSFKTYFAYGSRMVHNNYAAVDDTTSTSSYADNGNNAVATSVAGGYNAVSVWS